MRRIFYLILVLSFSLCAKAQMVNNIPNYLYSGSLGVGRSTANDANVYLQIGPNGASTRGVLLPRVADTSAITGTKRNGLLIYSNQLGSFAYFDSTSAVWRKLGYTDTTVISTKANTQKVVNDTAAVLRSLVTTSVDTTVISTKANTQKVVNDTAKVLRSLLASPSVKLNQIQSATSVGMTSNSTYQQWWQWTDPGTFALKLQTTTSSSTANSPTLEVAKTGTSSSNNARTLYVTNTLTNSGSVNEAGVFSASNGLSNYALRTINGGVKFETLGGTTSKFVKATAFGDLYVSDSSASASSAISDLTAATGTNTINNANYAQVWQWNSLGSASALKLSSTSTAVPSSGNSTLFELTRSGANANSSVVNYGIKSNITTTGTFSTNYGADITASGASLNIGVRSIAQQYALYGTSTGNSGQAYGVYGEGGAVSVQGANGNADGVAVRGDAYASSGTNYGGYFQANGSGASANYGGYFNGTGSSVENYGLKSSATGSGATGVYGFASHTSGSVYALYGDAQGNGAANKFGIKATAVGTGDYNYGASFSAAGGTNNHALVTLDGNVGFGTDTPSPKAIVEIASTNSGLLLPRMTKAQRDSISSPPAGLMIYQTDNTPGLRVYNGTNWMRYTETAD